MWRLTNNQHATRNPMIKEKTKNTLRQNRNVTFQNLWDTTKAILRGWLVINKPTQEIRKIPNSPPKFPPKGIRRANRAQSQQKKGNKVG